MRAVRAGLPELAFFRFNSASARWIASAAVEDQARGLRLELGQSLKDFQELTLAAFGTLRDGINAQVRGFGERLDAGIKGINAIGAQRVAPGRFVTDPLTV